MTRPLDDREALITALAEEARSGAREEPEPEELLDYLAGRLPPEDEQRLDRHLLASAGSARALLDLADFEAAEAEAGSRPPDVAVHAGWRDLEKRLPAARPWPHRLPAVLLPGIAAALLVTTVGLGSWVSKLQGELHRPIANVASHELSSVSRAGGEQALPVRAGEPLLLLLDPRESCAGYEAKVEGPEPGNSRNLPLQKDKEGYLTLMLQRPEPGPYRLRLYGCEPRRELEEHRFRIEVDDV